MKQTNGKFLTFIRKNAVYLVLSLCILAVGLSVAFMLINRPNESVDQGSNPPVVTSPVDDTPSDPVVTPPDDTPSDPVVTPPDQNEDVQPVQKPVTFIVPVAETTSVNDYSDTMVWNSTLGRFSAHKAVDFFAPEGTSVFAVFGGEIESVDNSFLEGYTVTVNHGNGLKTVYNSLSENVSVTVGQKINQGDVIGEVSVTNRKEDNDGAHLHFYMIEDGIVSDPGKYLSFENK
jgi:murein DD-endopeptidase MepM/ murein hydrolase activator NlpD